MALSDNQANTPAMFDALSRPRAFEEIIGQIEHAILTGRLNPGDRLPAERELSEMFGVSRSSVREAMRVLEMFGAVVTNPGRGRGSGSTIAHDASIGLRSAIRLHSALLRVPVRDVIVVRVHVEMQSARDAAREASADDISHLREISVAMREATSARQANAHDTQFHAGVARAAGNGFTPALVEGMREAEVRDMLKGLTALDDWEQEFALSAHEHDGIVGDIEQGDGEAAAQAMRRHILRYFEQHIVGSAGGELPLSELPDQTPSEWIDDLSSARKEPQ